MRIAIIGAGFSGLSVAWHLLEQSKSCRVVLFDPKGIGGGASGMAAGLLHPYVGEEGRRSLLASEGLQATRELIAVAEKNLGRRIADRKGVIRLSMNEELTMQMHSHSSQHGDVRHLGGQRFLIELGMTVDCPGYLEGLWKGIAERGGELILRKVGELSSMEGFDQTIVAAGSGVLRFPGIALPGCRETKGQVLVCRASGAVELPDRSLIGRGYVALSSMPGVCYVGSTYERGEESESPNKERAREILFPKIRQFFPAVDQLEIMDCRASMRVTRMGHYFPIATKIREGLYVLTAMGSRGLLYHAFLGRRVAEAVLGGDVLSSC